MDVVTQIAADIRRTTGEAFDPVGSTALGGGCINRAFKLADARQTWFVKTNAASRHAMFDAEFDGLQTLAESQTLAVPRPLCRGVAGETAYLVMQYVEMGRASPDAWRAAGRRLANMHRCSAPQFGWLRDNTIGSTTQANARDDDWIAFWRERRLGFQLELAARNGYGGRLQSLGDTLLDRCAALIDHAPQASLLHGDLWSGNLAFTRDGEPTIFDPAVYYGDREADLAMTELFGGFSADFYAAYRDAWPLDAGYAIRKTLYNLYHVINHLNLFGGGYGHQAERMMENLLSHC